MALFRYRHVWLGPRHPHHPRSGHQQSVARGNRLCSHPGTASSLSKRAHTPDAAARLRRSRNRSLFAGAAVWRELHSILLQLYYHFTQREFLTFQFRSIPLGTLLYDGFVLLAWSLLYYGINDWIELESQRLRIARAESSAHSARLRALQSQLEPHFLFNTLNAISTLVAEGNNPDANRMIARLSDFLRLSLELPTLPKSLLPKNLSSSVVTWKSNRYVSLIACRSRSTPSRKPCRRLSQPSSSNLWSRPPSNTVCCLANKGAQSQWQSTPQREGFISPSSTMVPASIRLNNS